jgi:HlyD family secretion protein
MSSSGIEPAPTRRDRKWRTRRWLPYLGAFVLVVLIAAGLWPKPVPVEIARAAVGTLRSTVDEEGKTRIKQRYVVSAPLTGQLRRIPFKAGAQVTAAETVLAVIDPLPPAMLDARARASAEAKRDSAAANLEKARAAHVFSTSELGRFERLYRDKTISIQELETQRLRDASATKEEAAAESLLRQAEAEVAEFAIGGDSGTNTVCTPQEVKAPCTGRVLRVLEENSRIVTAGMPLLEIGDPADIEVVIEVLSRDGAAIQPGTKVEFEQWGGSRPLLGRVRLVEPAAFTKVSALGVEEQRVNVVADLTTPLNERQNLGDNFRVEARIVVWEANEALKVPAGSLFRQGERWAAFVVAEGRAHLRSVKVGRSSGTETQVLEGLQQGDEVILYPGSRVRDGERVTEIKI